MNRFNPSWNVVDDNTAVSFEIDINYSNSIINIFYLPFALMSATTSISEGNKIISFDYDLSAIEYSNLEDRVARDIMTIAPNDLTPLTTLQTQYDGLSIDLQIVQIARYVIEDDLEAVKNEFEVVKNDFQVVKTGFNKLQSSGYSMVNQKFQIESSYEYSPGNFQADYGNYTFNGTYTATDIMKTLGFVTIFFMNTITGQKGYITVIEEIEFNLDRFCIDLTLDKSTHISFVIDLTLCTDIIDILGFPTTFQTLTVVDETGNENGGKSLREVFDRNLKSNVYTKLDDRVSRIIIGLENRVFFFRGGVWRRYWTTY